MKTALRITFSSIFLLCFICMITAAMAADVPKTLNYQGTLTDNVGQPVNGTKDITLNLYTVPTSGTAFWTETQSVIVTNGQFSVIIGNDPLNPLDTAQFTGETYIGVTVFPDPELAPRQKLTSVAYALKAEDAIPSGVIVMWSGAIANIPAGWGLCDGTNGTPNLRNKFIVGAGSTYAVTDNGGVATNNISHTHAGPSHRHAIDINVYSCIGDCTDGAQDGDKDVGSEDHGHHIVGNTAYSGTGQTGTGGSASLENRPPYYALAYIMKM